MDSGAVEDLLEFFKERPTLLRNRVAQADPVLLRVLEDNGNSLTCQPIKVYSRRYECERPSPMKCGDRCAELVNTVIKRYPDVSQIRTYEENAFLANPVYARDYPPARNLEPPRRAPGFRGVIRWPRLFNYSGHARNIADETALTLLGHLTRTRTH